MDLGKYDLTANAERGFDLELRDPLSGKKTDIIINVVGSDSKLYREALTNMRRGMAQASLIKIMKRLAMSGCQMFFASALQAGQTLKRVKKNMSLAKRMLKNS